jgi:hypothetical protein
LAGSLGQIIGSLGQCVGNFGQFIESLGRFVGSLAHDGRGNWPSCGDLGKPGGGLGRDFGIIGQDFRGIGQGGVEGVGTDELPSTEAGPDRIDKIWPEISGGK